MYDSLIQESGNSIRTNEQEPQEKYVLNRLRSFVVLFSFCCAPCLMVAQTGASLSGVVPVASNGVAVTVPAPSTDASPSQARTKKTAPNGAYPFPLLALADYRVKSITADYKSAALVPANAFALQEPGSKQTSMHSPGPEASLNPDALTWHGITLYGAYDVGFGWVSHGLPQSAYNYEGSSLVNRNAAGSRFLVEPNNLSQTGFGIRGKIEFAPGFYAVFNASTGINPQSGQLANASKTDIADNGLPRSSYSIAIDGARAGQVFNDEYFGGVSSAKYGTLTFGRQRALGTDTMLLYDPAGGSYAFSYIGYNGTMAGGGDTEDTRWDDAVKYRYAIGKVHAAAMYKFADGSAGCYSPLTTWTAANCTPEPAKNNAFGFNFGGEFHRLSADVVYQHYNDAISVLNPLLGPQSLSAPTQSTTNSINTNPINGVNLVTTDNTLAGIVTDNDATMVTLRYTASRFKLYGGYEYIVQNNPKNPLGVGATDQGGYLLSSVEDNNLDLTKIVQIWWTGVKYAYDAKTDITFAFYQQDQNDFRSPKTCSTAAGFRSSCAGTLNEASLYTDHHFTKRFDGFVGVAYSFVTGGLDIAIPHGPGVRYLHNSNFAPTIGGRFSF
jgi:predicted porin